MVPCVEKLLGMLQSLCGFRLKNVTASSKQQGVKITSETKVKPFRTHLTAKNLVRVCRAQITRSK
ncbi:hypothetical protein BaRGS_00000323, partial [Batillaria attramentaria]